MNHHVRAGRCGGPGAVVARQRHPRDQTVQTRHRVAVRSEKLAHAAQIMAEHPAALQLRLRETVVEVAAEKNSTLVLPIPVELLRFLERSTPTDSERADPPITDAASEPPQLDGPKVPDDPGSLRLDEPLAQTHSGGSSSLGCPFRK